MFAAVRQICKCRKFRRSFSLADGLSKKQTLPMVMTKGPSNFLRSADSLQKFFAEYLLTYEVLCIG